MNSGGNLGQRSARVRQYIRSNYRRSSSAGRRCGKLKVPASLQALNANTNLLLLAHAARWTRPVTGWRLGVLSGAERTFLDGQS